MTMCFYWYYRLGFRLLKPVYPFGNLLLPCFVPYGVIRTSSEVPRMVWTSSGVNRDTRFGYPVI